MVDISVKKTGEIIKEIQQLDEWRKELMAILENRYETEPLIAKKKIKQLRSDNRCVTRNTKM